MNPAFNGKKILITGASGFIGRKLLSRLIWSHAQIIRWSRTPLEEMPGAGNAEIVEFSGDLKSPEDWQSALKDVDYVFHLAAQTSTRVSDADPSADYQINVLPLLTMLEVCRKNNFRPTIGFSSTATVIGIPENLPVTEKHTERPRSIYDVHKLMGEKYLKCFVDGGVVSGYSLRLPNVYGAGSSVSSSERAVLNQMIDQALKDASVTVYEPLAKLNRDFIHVEDVVDAFLLGTLFAQDLRGRVFVVGSGDAQTLQSAFTLVAHIVGLSAGKKIRVKRIQPNTCLSLIDFRSYAADFSLFQNLTGWSPKFTLSEGIVETVAAKLKFEKENPVLL